MIANFRDMTFRVCAAWGVLLIVLAAFGLADEGAPPLAPEGKRQASKASGGPDQPEQDHDASDEPAVPVQAERAAAHKVTELGGWYRLDDKGHVIEVNMVYHESAFDKRRDNEQRTDQVLFHITEFPRLKRLMLTETQATDEGLKCVCKLRDLEELYIWDGKEITDDGVAHLQNLPNLKYLHLSGSKATDDAIALLGKISSIESLSMQGNAFTDKALEYAKRFPRLKSLFICDLKSMYYDDDKSSPRHGPANLTAAGLKHLREMPLLEELWIQGYAVADTELKHFHGLKNLKVLGINDADRGGVGEAAILELQAAVPGLKVSAIGKDYQAPDAVRAAADPKQQESNRQAAQEGLAVIRQLLDAISTRQDATAMRLADAELVGKFQALRRQPDFQPLKILAAFGDAETIEAISTAIVTYDIRDEKLRAQELEKRVLEKTSSQVVLIAMKRDGKWRVASEILVPIGAKDYIANYLDKHPGAQILVPPPEPVKP